MKIIINKMKVKGKQEKNVVEEEINMKRLWEEEF